MVSEQYSLTRWSQLAWSSHQGSQGAVGTQAAGQATQDGVWVSTCPTLPNSHAYPHEQQSC
jgi:hypothetical protein